MQVWGQKHNKIKDIGAVVLSVILALGVFFALGEVALRIYTGDVIFYDIEMTRYANELKLPSANPLIAHIHRPNGSSVLMGVPVEISADGLRDDDYPVARTESRRIAFLGDSLTFGWGVASDDTFQSILERELNQAQSIEILNFGTGNYNTEQQVNLFIEKGLKYAPDEVVVWYFINDAEPTPQPSPWAFLGHSRMATFVWSRVKTVQSRLFSSRSYQDYYADLYRDESIGWTRTKEAFIQLQKLAEEQGMEMKVVLLPELHDPKNQPFEREYAQVRRFLDGLDIQVLDLNPYFASEEDPQRLWVALDDAHPNAVAHARIAELTQPFVLGTEQ
jgi:lysophospholipase L1-like esterase